MDAPKFAVVDFKTTGLEDSDRVLEIGVVLLDSLGSVEGTWETLIDPDREFHSSGENGIAADDVADAPYFDYIARDFAELLRARILVAHNLAETERFLRSEFSRVGVRVKDGGVGVSTQVLGKQCFSECSETLPACLTAAGAPAAVGDSALAVAVATATLFQQLLPSCKAAVSDAEVLEFPDKEFEQLEESGFDPVPRLDSGSRSAACLQTLEQYDRIDDPLLAPNEIAYLDALVQALVAGVLTPQRRVELLQIATQQQLSPADIGALDEIFFSQIALSAGQAEWIPALAAELGVAEAIDSASDMPDIQLRAGDRVCFLGVLTLPREHWHRRAHEAGLIVSGLDRNDVCAVAGASGEHGGLVEIARDLELPVLDERTFANLIDHIAPASSTVDHQQTVPPCDLSEMFPWCPPESGVNDIAAAVQHWLLEHASTPLVEISQLLDAATLPDGLAPTDSAVSTWLQHFPEPLTATVENLRELPGVGEVRIKRFVYAAVLCAYDQAITRQGEQICEDAERPSETMDLAAGWLDLLGHWPDLEQIYVAQLAVPERLGHELAAATRPGERLIARAVNEIAALLHTDTKRRAAIIAGRATGAEHLQELGDRFGITRERIRQLEAALLKELRADAPACETVVSACAAAFSPCASLDTVFDLIPSLGARIKPDTGRNLLEILTWVYGHPGVEFANNRVVQWHLSNGWILFEDFESVVEECAKDAVDHNGVLQEQQLINAVLERFPGGNPERISDYCTEQLGYIRRGPFFLPPRSSILDRVAVELALHGAPMTTDQLHALISDRSRGSIVNVLGRSEIFVRSAMDTWALKEWGLQEWTNLSDFLLQRIADNGGEVPLEQLKEEAQRFGISEHSVGFYVSGPEYVLEDGIVRVNTETPVNDRTPEESKGMYFHDDAWMLLVTVTDDHLRGSGSAVPLGVAALYGLEFNEPFEIPSRLGPQTLRWGRVNCSLSTIRRFLEPMGVRSGDRVWFVFGDEFDILPALPAKDKLTGLAALLNAMALEADTEEDAVVEINLALGLPANAPRRQAVRRLRNRNDDELAELLRQV